MIENQTINRAIDYILAHIGEPIRVDAIAAHCNFSKYYFSRLFRAETGESVYEFIKRVKLEQSAFRLKVEQNRNITEISGEYGYSSSNYSSAFKQHHKMSPIEFRRSILQKSLENPIFQGSAVVVESLAQCREKISVEWLPDYFVVYERHKGSYRNLSAHWGRFQEKYKAYMTEETLLIELTYDDPNITSSDGCLFDLCMTVPQDSPLEHTCTLRGGRFAIYHFDGPVSRIYSAFQSVLTVWLPQSGYEIGDRYGFEIYRKVDCDAMVMGIDVCIPIK